MDYDNTNKGFVTENNKQGNENRPDYKGKLNVEGVDFEIAMWGRVSKKGSPYYAIKISPPRDEGQQPQEPPMQQQQASSGYDKFRQTGEALRKNHQNQDSNEISLDDIPF